MDGKDLLSQLPLQELKELIKKGNFYENLKKVFIKRIIEEFDKKIVEFEKHLKENNIDHEYGESWASSLPNLYKGTGIFGEDEQWSYSDFDIEVKKFRGNMRVRLATGFSFEYVHLILRSSDKWKLALYELIDHFKENYLISLKEKHGK